MNKSESLWENWKEMIHCMEMEIQAQEELIDVQKGQIKALEDRIRILENQKKKLADAGNGLAKQSEVLERLCMSQQELLEEFRSLFSDLPTQP